MRKCLSALKTLLCCGLAVVDAAAAFNLNIARVHSTDWDLRGLAMALDRNRHGATQLDLRVDALQGPEMALKGWRWRCLPSLTVIPPGFRCAGAVEFDGDALGVLDIAFDQDWRIALRRDGGELSAQALATGWRIVARDFPLDIFAILLPGRLARSGGSVAGEVEFAGAAVRGELVLRTAAADTVDGANALAEVEATVSLAGTFEPASALELDVRIRNGQVLWGAWYADLPEATRFTARFAESKNGGLDLLAFEWRDGDAASVRMDRNIAGVGTLHFNISHLDATYSRYLAAGLAVLGAPSLGLEGAASGAVSWRDESIAEVRIELENVELELPQQRFALSDFRGTLAWTRGAEVSTGNLAWGGGAWRDLPFGAGNLQTRSSTSALQLAAPTSWRFAGGDLSLSALSWWPGAHSRLEFSAQGRHIALDQLSRALGWPTFAGGLALDVRQAIWVDDRLEIGGGIELQVFEGEVGLDQLVIERAFGVAPALSANVSIERVELEPLTGAFGVGAISGRVDGRLEHFRMVGGQAVAFDAHLVTSPGDSGRRRISQRAVGDLSRLGGGPGGGLHGTLLRPFDSFAYKRIGLRCRLRDNVCTMGGIEGLDRGERFVLLEGAGLPRVDIAGFQRRVAWPVLVERLRAAATGGAIEFKTGGSKP